MKHGHDIHVHGRVSTFLLEDLERFNANARARVPEEQVVHFWHPVAHLWQACFLGFVDPDGGIGEATASRRMDETGWFPCRTDRFPCGLGTLLWLLLSGNGDQVRFATTDLINPLSSILYDIPSWSSEGLLPFQGCPFVQQEFDSLADRMHRICGRSRIYFFANEGNWGDALIRAGTLRFLRHYGFDFIELTSNRQKLPPFAWFRSNVLIYGGGGGWCSLWNHAHAILQRQARHFDQIVVLPSTFEHAYKLENATFFCRDRFESQEAMPEAAFCHDMAFFLGRQCQATGEGTGSFFRTDPESSGRVEIPDDNCDLSCEGDHRRAIDPFFDRIAAFRVIRTDRLHVAIAACLLGRELHFYPGSYFKNRAVFLSSMEGRFEGATFHDV